MDRQRLEGKFIVLDGPDGAGKSTQVRLLSEFIERQGVVTLTVRDPGGTRIGEQIRQILLDRSNGDMSGRCESLLYMASRAQLYHECIRPALAEKKCVICDRWVSSTYAYQAVGGGVGTETVLKLAEISLERSWPDLTIIIDMPSRVGLERLSDTPDRIEEKPLEFHQQVRQGFLDLAQNRRDFRIVDGTDTIGQVHQRLCEVILAYVNS